ncbi:MAG: hypothetical protein ACHQU0_03475 [Candidatus Paceibacteria bacterium]
MFAEVIAVVLAGAAIAAYFERKALKADAVAAEANVTAAFKRVGAYVSAKEVQVREQIAKDVAKAIADAKADAEKIEADIKADASKTEGAVKGVIVKLEADIKKVI